MEELLLKEESLQEESLQEELERKFYRIAETGQYKQINQTESISINLFSHIIQNIREGRHDFYFVFYGNEGAFYNNLEKYVLRRSLSLTVGRNTKEILDKYADVLYKISLDVYLAYFLEKDTLIKYINYSETDEIFDSKQETDSILLRYQKIDYDLLYNYFSKETINFNLGRIRENYHIFFPFKTYDEFEDFYKNKKKFSDDTVIEYIRSMKVHNDLTYYLIENNYISDEMEKYITS